jgi:quercetin dioxygenase-like cupin family protein
MRAGDVVVDGTETFRILRSAAEDGVCEIEVDLAPGAEGPPLHTHEEPEQFEVLEGTIIFWLDGVERRFSAGDRWVISPGCVHSFKNASTTQRVRARGIHGGRFERLIDQLGAGEPRFLRMALYASTVDPRASHMVSPLVRALLHGLALVARLRGVALAPATGRYGIDGRGDDVDALPRCAEASRLRP